MSELRIGLVAEGATDYEVIHASLRAFLGQAFIMTRLQPEPTEHTRGEGWSGVANWCNELVTEYDWRLGPNPLLSQYDIVIIHVDADVAAFSYTNVGGEHGNLAALARQQQWRQLPCASICPPASESCDRLASCVRSWLGSVELGIKVVICIPSKSSGAWLAHAVLQPDHPLLVASECNSALEAALPYLPKGERVRKSAVAYRAHAPTITKNWDTVKAACSQASRFQREFLAALPPTATAAP